jgi:dTDP-4-amino-4,6-dideoxygalactose transaminase
MEPIQLFVPTFRIEETLAEIRVCLEKGWTGLGYKTVEFEEAWKAYTGLPHAHFLNSATAGLHLAVRVLKEMDNWGDQDEIISTPLTFVSSNHAILYENLKVVFADIDEYLSPLGHGLCCSWGWEGIQDVILRCSKYAVTIT